MNLSCMISADFFPILLSSVTSVRSITKEVIHSAALSSSKVAEQQGESEYITLFFHESNFPILLRFYMEIFL